MNIYSPKHSSITLKGRSGRFRLYDLESKFDNRMNLKHFPELKWYIIQDIRQAVQFYKYADAETSLSMRKQLDRMIYSLTVDLSKSQFSEIQSKVDYDWLNTLDDILSKYYFVCQCLVYHGEDIEIPKYKFKK